MSNNNQLLNDDKVSQIDDDSLNNDDYEISEELNLGLYNKICSVLLNILGNSFIRNVIKTDKNILNLIQLQISNLFFLEKKISDLLQNHKFAKDFLQIIANISGLELTIKKSGDKKRITILEDVNLLVVTVINTNKNITRESLERYRTIDQEAFENLNNQIAALDDFSHIEENKEDKELEQPKSNFQSDNNESNLNAPNFNNNNLNNNFNPNNMRDLNNNLNNLTKLGILPQHPATKPNFYPYLTKPKVVPKLKKVIASLLGVAALFLIITIIISTFVKGSFQITEGQGKQDFVLSQINNWVLLIVTILVFVWAAYTFVRPPRNKRESFHTSSFVLIIVIFWLAVTVGYLFWSTSDNYYKGILQQFVKDKGTYDPSAVSALKNLANYNLYYIFVLITAIITIIPIAFLILLVLINPRLDRNKIIRANQEYQNAITAAMNGKSYEVDSSLFDNDDNSIN